MSDRRLAREPDTLLRWACRLLGRAAIVLAVIAPAAFVSAVPRTVTKTDIRTDPPTTTHNRLRDVVWDMVEREDMRREADPKRPLGSLFFRTRKRGTEVPSLCRFDSLVVEFAPLDRRQRAADTKVQAIGLRAHSNFRFLAPPADEYETIADYDRLPSDTDCGPLDGKEEVFFFAEDEPTATDGYRALLALQQALRDGTTFALHCDLPKVSSRECGKEILALDPGRIGSIERCEAESARRCFRIANEDLAIAITVTGRVYPGPPPGQIVSARMNAIITLYHPRPD